jgi:hypothetical protein
MRRLRLNRNIARRGRSKKTALTKNPPHPGKMIGDSIEEMGFCETARGANADRRDGSLK